MNIFDVYGDSKWLKAADLKGRKVKVRIQDWSTTEFSQQNGTTRKQIVLSFHGAEKKLGLNKTNAQVIASLHGDDPDQWLGCEISLYPTKTQNQSGQIVDCIRIDAFVEKPAKPTPKAKQSEMNPPPHTAIPDDMNDEIPF